MREAIEIGKTDSALAATVHPGRSAADDSSDATDDVFGEYDLVDEIARGGMGVVYKAHHRRLNRPVALKMILAGRLASEQDIQRFQREAEAAANLDHPGIVPIYEIGEQGKQHFFTMKLVEGGSLASRMEELRHDIRAFVRLIERVSRAVHYAHQRGILHRDLKPANILLDEDGQPLITDLGLARQMKSASDITRTGAVVGTPAYMPPEQAAAKKEMTTAVDIYSTGAMLYEALTGQPPHVGDSPVETLMQVMNDNVVPPRELNRRVDRQLERIVMNCLEKEPNDRYASAAALADDLDNWLNGRTISVRRTSLTSAVTDLLRTNMRSAVGAAIVGIVAGIVLAYCISRCNSSAFVRNNPPALIYETLPAEIPIGRSMVFLQEGPIDQNMATIAGLCWFATMVLAGAFVALVARPKPGTEAVAIGVVSGVFMAITLYTLHIGFGSVSQSHAEQIPELKRLVDAAVGSAERQAAARTELFAEYPGLQEISPDDRSRFLTFRLVFDGMFQIPVGVIWGIAMSTLLCLFPCLVGTTFASKLLHEPNANWKVVPAYLELMFIILALILIGFFSVLLPIAAGTNTGPTTTSGWGRLGVLVLFLTLMAVIAFRRNLAWYWRLAMTVGIPVAVTILSRFAYSVLR